MSCLCDYSLSNTGTPSKQGIAAVTKKLIFVRMVDDAGNRNSVDVSDTLDAAFFEALTRAQDPSARWYPTPEVKNVEDTRAETVFETYTDGSNAKVREGIRSFMGVMIDMGPVFLSKLQGFACEKMGVYFVDACGKLVGSISSDGTQLYPIMISTGSFDATLVKATDALRPKVQVKFDISVLERDENLRIADTEADVDLNALEGMLDVIGTTTSISTTSFTVKLNLQYGPFGAPIKVEGFVLGDFSLYNEDDAATVAITSLLESPAGTYTINYAAQGSGETLTVRGQMDSFLVTTFTVLIP
jgi:hypothetical protein